MQRQAHAHIVSAHLMHKHTAPAGHASMRKRRMLYLCFYLQVCGEEKGSAEIKEGRVTSHVEHQRERETVKSGDKPFLVETEAPQLTRPCKVLTVMKTMEDRTGRKQTKRAPASQVYLEAKWVTTAPIIGLETQNGNQKCKLFYFEAIRELLAQGSMYNWTFDFKLFKTTFQSSSFSIMYKTCVLYVNVCFLLCPFASLIPCMYPSHPLFFYYPVLIFFNYSCQPSFPFPDATKVKQEQCSVSPRLSCRSRTHTQSCNAKKA